MRATSKRMAGGGAGRGRPGRASVLALALLGLTILALLGAGPIGCQKESGKEAKLASGEDRSRVAAEGAQADRTQAERPPGEPPAATDVAAASAAGGQPAVKANQPPRGRLEAAPLRGYANMTSIHLTSASSADDFDLAQEMKRRWDFDGDGEWDTGLLRSDFVKWTYPKPGRYEPRLLLVDTGGLSDTCYGPAIEILEPCPAPAFALEDINPNAQVIGKTFTLEGFRGRPLLVWFGSPSK